MLNANGLCFVSSSTTNDRAILHPGKVQDADTFRAALHFQTESPLPKTGAVTLYADYRGKFYKQNCKVVATKSAGNNVFVNIERLGDPEPVESSVDVRINVGSQNITLSVGKQINCQLIEIGEEGLTVIPQQPLEIGSNVDISFSIDGIYGNGPVKVEAQHKTTDGKAAFSLVVANRKSSLIKSIEALGNIIQRRQIRGLAVAA